MKLRTRFALPVVALVFSIFAGVARGLVLDTAWVGTSGAYENPANWSGGNLPNIALGYFNSFDDLGQQYAGIDNGGTAVVTTADTTTATADQLFVGVNNGNSGNLFVQDGGILTVHSLSIGYNVGATGSVTVTGPGSQISGGIYVGAYGTGTLTIESGGSTNAGSTIRVGWKTGSVGTVLVTGTDSSVQGSIGAGSGTAHITITDHANVSQEVSGSNSNEAPGTADITISNYATVSGIHGGIGSGTTTFTITDHGSVSDITGGNGTTHVTVDDYATVTNNISSGNGDSDITINGYESAGGYASLTSGGDITLNTGGTATLTIDGGSHSIGNITVSGAGANTFTLQGGASLESAGYATIGSGAGESGTLNLVTGGKLTVANAILGYDPGSFGTVTIDGVGSELHVTTELDVGNFGSGNLTVSNGGKLTTDSDSYVGYAGGGSVTVTDAGSQWIAGGDIHLAGNGGSGSLTLANDGYISINSGSGALFLKSEGSGSGVLNIGADAGSAAATPGTLDAAFVAAGSGGSAVVVFNHTATPYFFSPKITGDIFVVHKSGITVLTGANDYTGGNFVSGGTLALGHENAFGSGDMNLAGGTLYLNGYNQASGQLLVSGNSFIDFGSLTSALSFTDSRALNWSGTLTLLGFGGDATLQVGTDANGLTPAQLALIDINGFVAEINNSGFLSASSTAFTAPVPEPSTYAALAGLAALGAAAWRRRSRFAVRRF